MMPSLTVSPSPWEVWPGYTSAPAGFRDEAFDFIFNAVTVPLGVIQIGIPLRVDFDADFYLRSLQCFDATDLLPNGGTLDFTVRFTDPTGQYLQKVADLAVSLFTNNNLGGYQYRGSRVPIWPEIRIPAGSLILVDLIATNFVPVIVDLYLVGVKRFNVGSGGVGSCPLPGGGY